QPLIGALADGKKLPGCDEVSGTVSQEQQDLVVGPAINDHVQLAVTVEVRSRRAMRMGTRLGKEGRVRSGTESALSVTQEDGHIGRLGIRDDEIRIAVAVEIADRDVIGKMAHGKRRMW